MAIHSSLCLGGRSKPPWSRTYINSATAVTNMTHWKWPLPVSRPRFEKQKTSIFLELSLGALSHHRLSDHPETLMWRSHVPVLPLRDPRSPALRLPCQGTRQAVKLSRTLQASPPTSGSPPSDLSLCLVEQKNCPADTAQILDPQNPERQ